jgi:hypothetical protein
MRSRRIAARDSKAILLTGVSLPLVFRPPHGSRGSPSGARGVGRLSNKANCDCQTALNRADLFIVCGAIIIACLNAASCSAR